MASEQNSDNSSNDKAGFGGFAFSRIILAIIIVCASFWLIHQGISYFDKHDLSKQIIEKNQAANEAELQHDMEMYKKEQAIAHGDTSMAHGHGHGASSHPKKVLHAKTMKDVQIVFDPYYQAILTHEIMGHPSEADRVLGREAASAGSAWWAGKIGERIGSEHLNIYDDPTIPGTMGFFPYDDEGVKTKRKILAEDGILLDHMHSRETAHIFNVEANAGMRAMTFEYSPLIRMSNTFMGGGDWKPEEIIEDTKKGVLVSTRKDNSIDDMRYNWTISAQEGWLIENGELTTQLKDVTVSGISPKLFASIDAVGNNREIKPVIGCGKGMQMLYTGNGGPHMRGIANIVGG